MHRLQLFLLFLLSCVAVTNAGNIPFVPSVYNYNTRDYKADNQNWAIAQGHDGIIYIGNNSGLLSFDGTNWNLHQLPNRLSVKSILIVPTEESERIFVGSFEEFGYFKADHTNQLVYHSLTPLLKNYTFRNDEIWTINRKGENIYFQSFRSYFVYNITTSEIRYEQPFPAPLYFFEVNGQLFSQFINNDFYQLINEQFQKLFSRQSVQNDDIVSILPFDNTYLLVSSENGIFEFNPETKTVAAWETEFDDMLKTAIANRAIQTPNFLVIGTLKQGVFAINHDGTRRWHLNHQNGLNNNTVLGLFNDREGNIWVALDNGISYIQVNSGLSFFEPISAQLGLVEDMLFHRNILYLATNRGVYNYSPVTQNMYQLPGLNAQSWFIRRFGEQIITGNNRGTAFIENNRGVFIEATSGGMDIKQAFIHNQDVLIKSTYHHLYIYRRNQLGQWTFSNRIDGFYDLISRIKVDHTGNIWAQHMYRGIYRLRLNNTLNSITEREHFPYLNPDNTSATRIRIMQLKGRIVFSDGEMFYTYDDIARRIIPFDRLNADLQGFEDANRIIPVNDSLFWFVRDNEYSLVGFRNNAYFVREKIPFAIFNNPPNTGRGNVYVDKNGLSFLGLNGGIAKFIPDNISHYPVDRLRLRTVLSYNRRDDSVNRLAISQNGGGESLSYADNNITFEFQFTHFSRKTFTIETYLEGYDLRWITVGDDLKISYINLPPGDFTLHARVINNFGQEISSLSYSFRIRQPWHRASWAIVLYIFLILFVVYFSVERYTKRIILKKQRVFAQQEKDRLSQIDKQEKIITTLENERLETDLLHKSKELASATMIIINHNEFLDKLKSEVKTYIHSGKINKTEGNKLLALITEKHSKEDDWAVFKENFDLIHENFFGRLQERYPTLTPTDLKLCSLLSLNYSSKEIANMLNLTIRGVEAARYRLRKKLNLSEDENLVSFIMEFR